MIHNYNLLQNKIDLISNMLEAGILPKHAYFELEKIYNKNKKLFSICLN